MLHWCENEWVCSLGKIVFMTLVLSFSSKLDWGSYIVSLPKTASRKIGTQSSSMKFLSIDIVPCWYRYAKQSRIEYCCHIWVDAPSCSMSTVFFLAQLDFVLFCLQNDGKKQYSEYLNPANTCLCLLVPS